MIKKDNNNDRMQLPTADSIIDNVRRVFESEGWMCNFNPNTRSISASFQLSAKFKGQNLISLTNVVDGFLMNCCQFPITITKERITYVAEYLHRINFLLLKFYVF